MLEALDLRRPIAHRLHHPPDRVDRDLDALAAQLVFDLARAEAGVTLVLLEDLRVAQLLDRWILRCRARHRFTLRRGLGLADPRVDRIPARAEILSCLGRAVLARVLDDLGLL